MVFLSTAIHFDRGCDFRPVHWEIRQFPDLLCLRISVCRSDSIPVEQLGAMDYPDPHADEYQRTHEGMITQKHFLAVSGLPLGAGS